MSPTLAAHVVCLLAPVLEYCKALATTVLKNIQSVSDMDLFNMDDGMAGHAAGGVASQSKNAIRQQLTVLHTAKGSRSTKLRM